MKSALRLGIAVLVIASALFPAGAHAQSISAKQAEARRIQAAIDAAGEKLSIADEDYNVARLERQRIEKRLEELTAESDAASARAEESQAMIKARVRQIYMHPGSYLAPWFAGGADLAKTVRARALSQSVVASDEEVLIRARKDLADAEKAKAELAEVADQAKDKESELKRRRASVDTRMAEQRRLLSEVNGEIADLIAQQRAREAAEAARRATAATTSSRPKATARPVDESEKVSRAGPARPSASTAVSAAASQIGKPYEWGAEGPDSYDCSGLTMWAWAKAGVSLPHSSRSQYASLPKVSMSELQPGDLVFYGNPIHHVGIYEGGGMMINAPQSGDNVKRSSIYRGDFAGAARP